MTTLSDPLPAPENPGWFTRTENWMDDKGKGAWIAAMVLGFVFFWPVGLALVLYMTYQSKWSLPMKRRSHHRHACSRSAWGRSSSVYTPSGNSAFDQYKTDTLARLEQEQMEFEAFLDRLREAKDKAEFDAFMDERAKQDPEEPKNDAA